MMFSLNLFLLFITSVHKKEASIILFNASNSLTINSSFIQSLCNLIPTYNQFILTESNKKCNTNTSGNISKTYQFNCCTNIMGNKQSTSTHQEDIYKLIFQLLANMVWAPETRSFLLKVSFYLYFILNFSSLHFY